MCKELSNEYEELIEACDCEDCTCEESETDQFTALEELVADVLDEILKVDINTDEVQNTPIDNQLFMQGVAEASRWAGQIAVYKAIGLTNKEIQEMCLNFMTAEYNLEQQKVINDGQIAMARTGQA